MAATLRELVFTGLSKTRVRVPLVMSTWKMRRVGGMESRMRKFAGMGPTAAIGFGTSARSLTAFCMMNRLVLIGMVARSVLSSIMLKSS